MTRERLPLVVALVALLLAAGVSCKPRIEYVPVPCQDLVLPARPHLPIEDYKPEWTRDQVLSAYTQSTILLVGWGKACEVIITAHNKPKVR